MFDIFVGVLVFSDHEKGLVSPGNGRGCFNVSFRVDLDSLAMVLDISIIEVRLIMVSRVLIHARPSVLTC